MIPDHRCNQAYPNSTKSYKKELTITLVMANMTRSGLRNIMIILNQLRDPHLPVVEAVADIDPSPLNRDQKNTIDLHPLKLNPFIFQHHMNQ